MSKKISLLALVIILLLINGSIFQKEQQLKQGDLVYLELAPVDPRSLMQGDYMALEYKLGNTLYGKIPKEKHDDVSRYANVEGKVIVTLDAQRRGTFKALYKHQTLTENEMLLTYRVRRERVTLASNAFFFQEGTGKVYEKAKYGAFRVKDGVMLLTTLHDENLKKLEPLKPVRDVNTSL